MERNRRRRPSAEGGAEELDVWFAMSSMAARKSGSVESGSGGGDGRRRCRRPSGLHRHWPTTGLAEEDVVVAAAELLVGLALTLDR